MIGGRGLAPAKTTKASLSTTTSTRRPCVGTTSPRSSRSPGGVTGGGRGGSARRTTGLGNDDRGVSRGVSPFQVSLTRRLCPVL